MQRPDPLRRRARRPAAAAAVFALHLLIVVGLWQSLREREVSVAGDGAPLPPLHWVQIVAAAAPAPAGARTPAPRPPAAPPTRAKTPARAPAAAAVPSPLPTGESIWVEPAPVAAAPAASAASAPPTQRLIDTEATRAAIRQTGQQALLHERAAQATGLPITRTDTALARGVAEAKQPDCLRDAEAASGHIGPIALGGILGLPFLAARVASGRCAK